MIDEMDWSDLYLFNKDSYESSSTSFVSSDPSTSTTPFFASSIDSSAFWSEIKTFESPNDENSQTKEKIKPKTSKRLPISAPTQCAICELPTRHCHYNAPACYGCKAFFRRSVLNGSRRYVCDLRSRCDVRGGSRCRSCRYDACLRAGMNIEGIRLPQSVDVNAIREEIARRKREFDDHRTEIAVVPLKFNPRFDQTADARVVDSLQFMELKFKRLRESTFDGVLYYRDEGIQNLLQKPSELGNADKHERPVNWLITRETLASGLHNIRNWVIIEIILNVEHLKAMPFFNDLDLDDRAALTVHVVLVTAALSEAFYSYSARSTAVMLVSGVVPLRDRAAIAPTYCQQFPDILSIEHDNFARPVQTITRVGPDVEDYCLLKAIIFCHSATPGLSEYARCLLEQQREVYASTLRRRLQAKLGTLPGARKYSDLINLVEPFFQFAQKKREFHFLLIPFARKRGTSEMELLNFFMFNSARND